MAPTPRRELNVLVTGFGPFMSVGNNPSWLAVRPLHDSVLDLSSRSSAHTDCTEAMGEGEGWGGEVRRARIQTLQVPVHYGSVLDLVPRLHGNLPSSEAEFWHDSRLDADFGGKQGSHYPEAYPLDPPSDGWDVVIHVGVGRGGSIRCETQAHAYSYGKPDANHSLAPRISLSPSELARIDAKHLDKDGNPRGFPSAYAQFNAIESTPVPVSSLLTHLQSDGVSRKELQQSFDPGRYLCDYIYYCSLCEAKRAGKGTKVLFIHVPPEQDLSVDRCRDVIRRVVWFVAKQTADLES